LWGVDRFSGTSIAYAVISLSLASMGLGAIIHGVRSWIRPGSV
jgi:hypothetical protein